ncbi:MAG: sulfatase-like hydrolase/transferase, partial [Pseudomonadota bacterium]|nr:sulfatase-like hydrolase/transferase [Pseudomonadota bacterium]
RLAASGMRFSNFHVAASCAPTRAMLMTGLDSHKVGVANIPEAIPEDQAHAPAYQGVLRTNIPTIAEMLQDAGYRTLMSGKWHLGFSDGEKPSQRGFDRTLMLADTGADNWRQRSYLPIYAEANWFEDGEPTTLPEDFYSSEYLVNKAIEYIGDEKEAQQPFFAYVAFQAVHIPVQAPAAFRDKYLQTYTGGWHDLRTARSEGLARTGILPAVLQGLPMPTTVSWQSLSAEQKAFEARGMAVYAGMVDAMDHHIGRLINHIDEIGELDNTVFIFLSDNGAEGSIVTRHQAPDSNAPVAPFQLWMRLANYNSDAQTLGERDSYHDIGPAWASAAVGPLSWYKFFAGEGGLRVPLVISGAHAGVSVVSQDVGSVSPALSWATDIVPTILGLAGVAAPDELEGKSLLPLLRSNAQTVRGDEDGFGYELGGNKAWFQGDHKLVFNRFANMGKWQLFNLENDPTESQDLSASEPERFASMIASYDAWAADRGVLPVAKDYNQGQTVLSKGLRNRPGFLLSLGFAALTPVLFIVFLAIWWRRRRLSA